MGIKGINASGAQTLCCKLSWLLRRSKRIGWRICNQSKFLLYLSSLWTYLWASNMLRLLQDIKSLQSLTLSGNWVNLVSLEHTLHRLPTLESLDLDHTGIVNVPNGLLRGNPSLRHLNLSQNLLVDLEPLAIDHLEKLETLDLSSNFLMGLSMQFFQEVEKKKRLRMVYLQVSWMLGGQSSNGPKVFIIFICPTLE